MTAPITTGLPLKAAAEATLTRLGWLLSPSIYGGTTAVHPEQRRRLDGLKVDALIELADEEDAKSKRPQ